MKAATFRRLALVLPDAVESAHMGHPDFRVHGKIFATLHTDVEGVVALTADQQEMFLAMDPELFVPQPGAWGRRGWTSVHLPKAKAAMVRSALRAAWSNKAPKSLQRG